MRNSLLGVTLLLGAVVMRLPAQSYLFYIELQGVAGWSSAEKKVVSFSMSRSEVMQKPGLGFDYVQRISGPRGDIAVLAVQGRLSLDLDGKVTVEPQLYNAYLKLKTSAADIWIGHNKPSFGLSTVLDNHGTLLQPLSMMGFGYDRDWGLGLQRDFSRGSAGISLTTGTGMGLKLGGGYLLAGRFSKGVLSQDNVSAGFSASYGKIYEAEGYELLSEEPMPFLMAGADLTWLQNNWEHNFEVMAGRREDRGALAVFWRTGLGLLEENKLKLEIQPALMAMRGTTHWQFAAGAALQPHPDWTLRSMVAYDSGRKDAKVLFQVYYYKGLRF